MIPIGCATRHEVHIFNQGYSSAKVSQVTAALDDAGFKTKPNHLAVPDQITRTSIIYPPIVQDFTGIDSVKDALSGIGFSQIELIHETQGEHYYSSENIGLYLVKPGYVPQSDFEDKVDSKQNLSRIYYSNCGDLEAQLNLYPAGAAMLELYDWNERTDREITIVVDGEWNAAETELVFGLFDGGEIIYSISEFEGRDNYGRFVGIDLDVLKNTTDQQSCNFRYISYDSRETLNRR